MTNLLSHLLQDVYHLFYPNLCLACEESLVANEYLVCIDCWSQLPETLFHLQINNPMEQKLWGRVHFEYATSMYYFNKDSRIQHLLHALKYKGQKEVGIMLGKRFAKAIEKCVWIDDIDILIPLPLSKKKKAQRGYNQSTQIALGMEKVLAKPVVTYAIERVKNTATQTKMTRSERVQNVEGAFCVVDGQLLAGKHVLLIDDVITTGATLEACANTILKESSAKVSIATLAYAIE